MKRITQLGLIAKKKYPGTYDHLSDEEVGLRLKKKHPEYNEFVDDQTFNNVTQLLQYYHPNKGRLASWWHRGNSDARSRLIQTLSTEQALVLNQGALIADAVMSGQKKMLDFELFLAQHQLVLFQMKANAHLIEQALEEGYTVENYQQVKLARESAQLKHQKREHKAYLEAMLDDNRTDNLLRLQDNEYAWKLEIAKLVGNDTDNQIRLAEALSKVKIREVEQLEALRMNNELALMKEQLKAAIIGKGIPHYETRMIAQEIRDKCYQEIEEIEESNFGEKTRKRMIDDREKILRFFDDQGEDLLDE